MSLKTRLAKYEAELSRLETTLSEQDRYDTLKAQGIRGAETKFVNVEKIHKRIEWLENRISNIGASLA